MKKLAVIVFMFFLINPPVFAGKDFDVIEFQKDEDITVVTPSDSVFQLHVEKTDTNTDYMSVQALKDLGRINIYDEKSYRKYDKGLDDKLITIDDSASVIIGSSNLYSAVSPDVLFVKRSFNYGDYGATLSLKGEHVNFAFASYNTSRDVGNSIGAVVASNPIKLPVGEMIIGSAVYSTDWGMKNEDKYGVFHQYKYKRLKLNTQVSNYSNKESKLDGKSFFIAPEIDITDDVSVSTSMQKDKFTNTTRNDLTIKYHPVKSDRNLELEVSLTNFSKPTSTYNQQRINFNTKFKI